MAAVRGRERAQEPDAALDRVRDRPRRHNSGRRLCADLAQRGVWPFGSPYRPVWLGLGTVAFDLLLALVATSLARRWLKPQLWRAVHWLAYAAWPVALVHAFGTGSDGQLGWLAVVGFGCLGAVALGALARAGLGAGDLRLRAAQRRRPSSRRLRSFSGTTTGRRSTAGRTCWHADGVLGRRANVTQPAALVRTQESPPTLSCRRSPERSPDPGAERARHRTTRIPASRWPGWRGAHRPAWGPR